MSRSSESPKTWSYTISNRINYCYSIKQIMNPMLVVKKLKISSFKCMYHVNNMTVVVHIVMCSGF